MSPVFKRLSRVYRWWTIFVSVVLVLVLGASLAFAQSIVSQDVEQMVRDALDQSLLDGDDLAERLELLQQEFDLPENLADLGIQALQDERVKELLGVENVAQGAPSGEDGERYSSNIFVFASFSIPGPSLKAILHDAHEFGLPVVFNGFVGNSVAETEAKIRDVFEGDEEAPGFTIDPTLFTRFGVDAVPVYISLHSDIDVCVTPGCAEDDVPGHDRLAGNVPIRTALELLRTGSGLGAIDASELLGATP